jgi:3-dehydro-L-gulonate 2-dehydrogenase
LFAFSPGDFNIEEISYSQQVIPMLRIPFAVMVAELERVLLKTGFTPPRAGLCAHLFAQASRDGVYSHGLNRFARFMDYIQKGLIDIHAEPVLKKQLGALEQWDGRKGPGNLNAWACMNRAMELARHHTLGCVALANTNHWMRAGNYGWQAVDAGLAAICWTNTQPNMPAWGGRTPKIGNNPLVIAVPRASGALVVDTAMSQFSFGKLESYRLQEQKLPVPGGFDDNGNLTHDPAVIEKNWQVLPIGYWKGASLSIMLDVMAAALAGGLTVHEIGRQPEECRLSQVFMAFDIRQIGSLAFLEQLLDQVIADLHQSVLRDGGDPVRYPGEHTLATRAENIKLGVPVQETIWQKILTM